MEESRTKNDFMEQYFSPGDDGSIPSFDGYINGEEEGQFCEAHEFMSKEDLIASYREFVESQEFGELDYSLSESETIPFVRLVGNSYSSLEEALASIAKEEGFDGVTQTSNTTWSSHPYPPRGYGGRFYTLLLEMTVAPSNGSCEVVSSTLYGKEWHMPLKEGNLHMEILAFQRGAYAVAGNVFNVSDLGITLRSSDGAHRTYQAHFMSGRTKAYQLPVKKGEDRMDEAAQMAVHDLLIDRGNHIQYEEERNSAYIDMVLREYEPEGIEGLCEKIKELELAVDGFIFPSFTNDESFRSNIQEVEEHKGKEAFNFLYPITHKGYKPSMQ